MVVNFDRQTYNAELLLPTKLEKLKPGYQIGPPWLRPLLTANFFATCGVHGDNNRNECNLYCLDCRGDALCSGCSPQHRDHHVVQIRRSSYHDVVRVSELQKVLDLGGVQTYIINSARVVFLNARPQPRHAKGVTKTCEICDRSLLDTFRYCSLGCKLTGIRRHNDMSFNLQPKNTNSANSCQSSQPQQAIVEDLARDRRGASEERGIPAAHIEPEEAALAPAVPARSGAATSEESSGGAVVGKRTRSSRKSPDNHRIKSESKSPSPPPRSSIEERERERDRDRVGEEEGMSLVQRSLGTLKLGRSSLPSSPSASADRDEASIASTRRAKSKKPSSPMAVNSPSITTELSPPTPPPTRTAKRRKGTPHRAPFGSAM